MKKFSLLLVCFFLISMFSGVSLASPRQNVGTSIKASHVKQVVKNKKSMRNKKSLKHKRWAKMCKKNNRFHRARNFRR